MLIVKMRKVFKSGPNTKKNWNNKLKSLNVEKLMQLQKLNMKTKLKKEELKLKDKSYLDRKSLKWGKKERKFLKQQINCMEDELLKEDNLIVR